MSNRPAEASAGSSGGLQSVDRALSVLDLLARLGESGASELAGHLDVHKSTVFRLLGALESHGLVEQPEGRGKYRLGFGVVRLAGAVSTRMELTKLARPVTERLADEIGETVNIAVLREHFAVNVDQALGPASVAAQNWVGRMTPLHATSSGKVLLAHVDAGERQRLVEASGLSEFTPETITTAAALDVELSRVLERGYALSVGEYEEGLNAIAVPMRDAEGGVVAALSASGPSYRFAAERMEQLSVIVIAAGAEASRRLGHIGS
ncbi:MAG TPA: IclR family transcriptional regulator [Nocardioides sp.]